jgi:hypothetical protein
MSKLRKRFDKCVVEFENESSSSQEEDEKFQFVISYSVPKTRDRRPSIQQPRKISGEKTIGEKPGGLYEGLLTTT